MQDRRIADAQRAFSEFELVGVAAGVWVAAWFAFEVPVVPALVCVALAVLTRHKWLMASGLVVLAAALGSNAEIGYRDATSSGLLDEEVVVMSDTHPFGYGSLLEVSLQDGRRVELVGYGAEGFELERATVGSSLDISGVLQPVDGRQWLKTRHIVGRVSVNSVEPLNGPPIWKRPPEWLRSLVFNGSEVFSEGDQALYSGLVVGDDRFQTADQRAQFQVAGLTHLLAVSGQNVAFVMAVLSPGLLRLGRYLRWLAVVVALVIFALATRAEPSVLRATVSVGLATSLTLFGLRASGIRIISLVSISLIYLDPFLARSVGFQLSVAASAGILILGPILQEYRRLPSFIWTPLSVTLAAQLAVAPLLLVYFGRLGLVSIPANLAVGWAAGAVMMWGLTIGVVAGLVPSSIAEILQLPAEVLLWWIQAVASFSAGLPAPVLTAQSALPVAAMLSAVLVAARWRRLRIVLSGALLCQLVFLIPRVPHTLTDTGDVLYLPPNGDAPSVLIVRSDASDQLVTWVTQNRIGKVDIVVFESGDRRANSLASALQNVVEIRTILAPAQHRVVGARRVVDSVEVASVPLVSIEVSDRRLDVVVADRWS